VVIEGFRNYPILTLCVNQLIQAGGEGDVGRSVCVTRKCQNTRGPVLIGVFPMIAGRKVGGRRGA
jgi:hypothetical protein